MSDVIKSNITIASNICDYDNFHKNVLGFDELVKMTNKYKFDKSAEQSIFYHRGAIPYYCNNHDEISWGFVKNSNGEIVQSCRCEKPTCSYYNKCMGGLHSKIIIRNMQIFEGSTTPKKPAWISLEGGEIL